MLFPVVNFLKCVVIEVVLFTKRRTKRVPFLGHPVGLVRIFSAVHFFLKKGDDVFD